MKQIKWGVIFLMVGGLLSACAVKDTSSETELTPQQQIINSIALTSFPDRTVVVDVPADTLRSLKVLQNAVDSCSLAGGGTVKVNP